MIGKIKQFLQDVEKEMKKVNWPEYDKLVNSTFVVVIISALFTVFIYLADVTISFLINFLYS